jgi:hypothetical protein
MPLELVLFIGLPVSAAIVAGGDPVVNALYGPAYAEPLPYSSSSGSAPPRMCVNFMFNQILTASKRATGGLDVGDGGSDGRQSRISLLRTPMTAARYDNSPIGAALVLVETEVVIAVFGVATVGVRPRSRCGRLAHGGRVGRASATACATRPFGRWRRSPRPPWRSSRLWLRCESYS